MNIGCDIESVGEFRSKWKSKNKAFFKRVFSEQEIEYCSKFKDPSLHFTARFCAKEAFVKAANNESFKPLVTSIHVVNGKSGAPEIKAWKKSKELTKFFSSHRIMVSLSHTEEVAMACVLIHRKK